MGDYVVHINHGIGVYNGLKTLLKNGNQKDYLEINYQGQDKLFIPVEKIDLISKYSSKEGYAPKLNKLGGSEWQKTKLRIKNKVKDIADKLIKISAERSMKEGFAFKTECTSLFISSNCFITTAEIVENIIAENEPIVTGFQMEEDFSSILPIGLLFCKRSNILLKLYLSFCSILYTN